MTGEVLLKNGLVIRTGAEQIADVRVSEGIVTEVGSSLSVAAGSTVIDCHGCWVGPGFFDLHTHLREPGGEHKEDIASGSAAAASGGFTAVVAMPNTVPAIDNASVARFVADQGRRAGLVDVFPSGTLTVGRAGMAPAPFDELFDEGVRLFTDDGDTVEDAKLLRSAMAHIARLGGVVTEHAIDPELAAGGFMHEGAVSAQNGVKGIPSAAETAIVERDLALVAATGVRYHLQHVSAAETVALIEDAKDAGLPVTAEVTPHHLAFDDSFLSSGDPNFKMMPPLRSRRDRQALRDAVKSGVIDAVATDHAPHTEQESAVPFAEAPFGVLGLADAAAVVNTSVGLDPSTFFQRMSVASARIAATRQHGRWVEPGNDANLVVFDPEAVAVSTTARSRSVNSPYLGRSWKGSVVLTMLRGFITYNTKIQGK